VRIVLPEGNHPVVVRVLSFADDCVCRHRGNCLQSFDLIFVHLFVPPNGPELTGADPHAQKYSARKAARRGAVSGAAWSWAALVTIDQTGGMSPQAASQARGTFRDLGRSRRKPSRTMTRANMPHAMHEPADRTHARGTTVREVPRASTR
jgi:hypothetical protein